MNTKMKLAAAASAATLLVVGFGAAGADAAKWITGKDIKNNSITGADIKNNSLTGADIKNGSINAKQLSTSLQKQLDQRAKDGARGPAGPQGPKGEDGASAELAFADTFERTTIQKIGGSFKANATEISEFTLAPGTYLIQMDAIFYYNKSTPMTSAPQLQAALRIEDEAKPEEWGVDAGTVFATFPGVTTHEREAQGSSFRVIELDQESTVTLYGFGYNPSGSGAGAGQFDVMTTVVAQKIG